MFWQKAKEYLEEEVGSAVDDRRHSTVYCVAKAVSVCDLREKVVERCPKDMLVPSDEWIRLLFSPVCLLSHSDTALRYTSWLFGSETLSAAVLVDEHENAHYAAYLFCYEREYAVLMRSHPNFACIDDKHGVKIGEPDAPVVSAERG